MQLRQRDRAVEVGWRACPAASGDLTYEILDRHLVGGGKDAGHPPRLLDQDLGASLDDRGEGARTCGGKHLILARAGGD